MLFFHALDVLCQLGEDEDPVRRRYEFDVQLLEDTREETVRRGESLGVESNEGGELCPLE